MPSFWVSDAVLLLTQATLVLLPGIGSPRWMASLRGRAWALAPALSIVVVVAAIAAVPGTAQALTWIALLLVPVGAVLALAWAARWPRRVRAGGVAVALLALAVAAPTSLGGETAVLLLCALSAVTLARVSGSVTPLTALKIAIVMMALLDSALVIAHLLQGPNDVLVAARPAAGLPQLQDARWGSAVMGYGDLFVAALLGTVLAAESARRWPIFLLTLGLAAAFDLLFLITDELPATVPVATALVLVELMRRHARADPPLDFVSPPAR